jgi:hypothetical protein
MGGSKPFSPAPDQAEIDLIVLFFGADLESEARVVRDKVLPAVATWCVERGLQLRAHPRWPKDTAQDGERIGYFRETPILQFLDLIEDEGVFVLAIIGADIPDLDVELIKFVRNARPGYDRRVRYVLLPRRGGYAEAVRSLFAELWREAQLYGYEDLTQFQFEQDLIRWLDTGLGPGQSKSDSESIESPDSTDFDRIESPHRDWAITWGQGAKWGYLHDFLRVSQYVVGSPGQDRTPAAVVDENVQFTVYRPNAVKPEVWYPLLAFAHLAERRPDAPPTQPDPLEQVRTLAAQVLGDHAAYGGPRVDARGGVPRQGQLTFVPFVESVDFNPRSQTFEWQEDVHQQNFRFKARDSTAGHVMHGQLTVYLGAFILADIDLTFRVESAAPPPPAPSPHSHSNVRPVSLLAAGAASATSSESELTPVTAVPYQKVFPSYSHKDLAIVRQAEAYGKALGHVYLRDRLTLRSGEEWETRLLDLIDKADIFQLFWSTNSMRSEYVRREWEHALTLGRRAFIRPTYWEVPMPRSDNPRLPPDALAELHFHGFYEDPNGEEVTGPRAAEEWARREAEAQALREAEVQARCEAEAQARPEARMKALEERARREAERQVVQDTKALYPARRTRRLWLIVATLAVLVALAVAAFLLRG